MCGDAMGLRACGGMHPCGDTSGERERVLVFLWIANCSSQDTLAMLEQGGGVIWGDLNSEQKCLLIEELFLFRNIP